LVQASRGKYGRRGYWMRSPPERGSVNRSASNLQDVIERSERPRTVAAAAGHRPAFRRTSLDRGRAAKARPFAGSACSEPHAESTDGEGIGCVRPGARFCEPQRVQASGRHRKVRTLTNGRRRCGSQTRVPKGGGASRRPRRTEYRPPGDPGGREKVAAIGRAEQAALKSAAVGEIRYLILFLPSASFSRWAS